MEYLNAFLCGGVLCAIGQILIDKTKLTPARILTGYVVAGVILSAVGLYQPIADWGGAGANCTSYRFWPRPGQRCAGGGGSEGVARGSDRRTHRHCWWNYRRCGVWRCHGGHFQARRQAMIHRCRPQKRLAPAFSEGPPRRMGLKSGKF